MILNPVANISCSISTVLSGFLLKLVSTTTDMNVDVSCTKVYCFKSLLCKIVDNFLTIDGIVTQKVVDF